LIRDRDLDNLAPDRHAQDRDPEKVGIAVGEQHRHRMFGKLSKLFGKWNCWEYAQLLRGERAPPFDPDPEVEIAAVRAVSEWLAPAPTYPRYTTPQEQQELRELRRCLTRAAEVRLGQLGSGRRGKAVMPSLGNRQYQVGEEVVAVNYAEDGVPQAYLRPPNTRAMQKDQLVSATNRDDAPRILKRLKDNHPGSLGLAIDLPEGKKNSGGYRVNIKAAKRTRK
jgi:hypothetical protein